MAAITRTFKSFELTAYELDDSIPPSVRTVAQYVVLDTNILEADAKAISDTRVVYTISDGRIVYEG